MKLPLLCAAALAAALSSPVRAEAPEPVIRDLSPGGTLRVAVAVGTSPTAFRAVRDPATGAPKGVAIDLARALAEKLGVPMQLVPFATPSAITDTAATGAWDVAFLPADVERARNLDFSTPYYLVEGTYLVRPGSAVRDAASVDRAGVRVAAIAGSTTMNALGRTVRKATVVPFRTEQEVRAAFTAAKVDVVAMGRESLERIAQAVPGSRVLDSESRAAGVGIALPKNRPDGLAYLTRFVEEAKASGAVERAMEAAGVRSGVVAPAVGTN